MTIHHATVKKAEQKGIVVEDAPEGSDLLYRSFCPEIGQELWGNDARVLVDAAIQARMFTKEYPGLKVEQDGQTITFSFGSREIGTVEDVADLADALTEVLEEMTDEERAEALAAEADDEEVDRRGSVVPDKYKKEYASAGHAGTCGDWLALVLIKLTTGQNGKLDVEALEEIARLNGVSTDKLNRESRGWQGRFRMTVRNMLVKVVAKAGFLLTPEGTHGDSLNAPDEWLKANAPKPKEAAGKKPKGV